MMITSVIDDDEHSVPDYAKLSVLDDAKLCTR